MRFCHKSHKIVEIFRGSQFWKSDPWLGPDSKGGQPTARGPQMAREQFLCGPPGPQRKRNTMDMCTLARVMSAARDENYNDFAARGGKKVAHHCPNGIFSLKTWPLVGLRLSLTDYCQSWKKSISVHPWATVTIENKMCIWMIFWFLSSHVKFVFQGFSVIRSSYNTI